MSGNHQRGFHWTPLRKVKVINAIQAGETTREAAMLEHGLSPDELESWLARYDRFGRRGLSVIHLQQVGR